MGRYLSILGLSLSLLTGAEAQTIVFSTNANTGVITIVITPAVVNGVALSPILSTTNVSTTNAAGQVSVSDFTFGPLTTNLLKNFGSNSNTVKDVTQVSSGVLAVFKDVEPFLKNEIVQLEGGVLYDDSAKKGRLGWFADVQVPVAGQASVGFGTARINGEQYDASISARIGMTVSVITNVPFLGPLIGPFYGYLEDGPSYSFVTHSVGSYNFVGLIKRYNLDSGRWEFTFGAAVGDISTLPGTIFAGGASVFYHW